MAVLGLAGGADRPARAAIVLLPPTSLTAAATSSSSVALRWGDPNSTERGYSVERSLLPTSKFRRVKLLPPNSVSYTDTGLAGGTTYYYRVTTAGTSKHSAVVPVTTGVGISPTPTPTPAGDTSAPSVPSGLSGSASTCTQVSLSWRASSDTGGSGLQGYRVFRNGVDMVNVSNPAVSATDTGLSGGAVYNYAVTAVDNAGNESGQSATLLVNTPPCSTSGGPWAKRFGGAGSELAEAVAVDAAGNIVVVGEFRGVGNFGGSPLTSAGGADVFVAKYDPSGAHLWSKRFGGSDDEGASTVAVGPDGSIFVGGYFRGASVDVGGGALRNAGVVTTTDGFIAKYSAAGQELWSRRYGGTDVDAVNGLAVDSNGDVLAVGLFRGTAIDFGGTALSSTWGGQDSFVVKLGGADGHDIWARNVNCGGPDNAKGVAVDRTGNVYVIGEFAGNADFGSGTFLTTAGMNDVYLAKYSPTGGYLWAKRFGDTSSDTGSAVAVDPAGNVAITGSFLGTVNFGGANLTTAAGAGDIYVARFSATGAHIWSKNFGNAYINYGLGIGTDDAGDVMVTGTYYGTISFGGGALANASSAYQDAFVAEFSPTGAHLWSSKYGGTDTDQGHGVVYGPNGPVVVGYFLSPTIDLGAGALTNAGGADGFLLSLGN